MKISRINNQGSTLILTILLMSLLLFLGMYALSLTATEYTISHNHAAVIKTYYLTEAGLHEMIFKLKNDPIYKDNFENDPNWSATFTTNNPFYADSQYQLTIQNTDQAHGNITATGVISNGANVQRVVKTTAFKALGQSGIIDNTTYASGNIDISLSKVNFYNGSAYSNNNFIINGISTVNIDSDLNAKGNFNQSWMSTVNVGGETHAANYPPAAEEIEMPAVDFDSSSPDSYKNTADVIYTSNEFEDLMENDQNLILNGPITYVEGDVSLEGGQNLTINGLLVVERDFAVGDRYYWGGRSGRSSVTVNHTEGQPSGILAKRKIDFDTWTGNVDIYGLVYANDLLKISGFPLGFAFTVRGGLIGRKLTITSAWQDINIYHDNNVLVEALEATELSPVISIDHWEEEY